MSAAEIEIEVLQDVALQWRLDLYGWAEFVQNSTTTVREFIIKSH